jgi:hypothetical protein
VGVDEAGKGQQALRVVNLTGTFDGNVWRDAGEFAVADGDIDVFECLPVGTRQVHVLNEQVVGRCAFITV